MDIQKFVRGVVMTMMLFGGAPAASAAEMTSASASAIEQSALSVNVNTANAEELADLLNGVGMSRARAIVEFREANGPFKSAQDLTAVRGIGQATLDRNLTVIRLK